MGLLDDAIRQHLELKRRHGADPGEVAELEREALGPVRRGEALAVPAATATPEVDEPAPEPSGSTSISRAEELAYEETVDEADPDVLAESTETHTLAHDEEAAYEETLVEADEHEQEHGGAHSISQHVEPPAPAVAPGDEDVLEETPEFLQETPEHDRLWFEQKPPRDFDF